MRSVKFAVMVGLGLMAGGWSMARAQDAASTPAPTVAALPGDQQATKEQIAKLFEVMHLQQQMATMQKMMPSLIAQQMKEQQKEMLAKLPGGGQLTPEQQEKLDNFSKHMIERAFTVYTTDEIVADISGVYQRHISREDADALIAFYSTPPAQRLLEAQPVIAQESMPLVMAHMKERMKTFTDETTKEMQEMMKSTAPAKN